MFAYPKQAEFNRVVPKAKIYAHAKGGKRLKERFVSDVEEIIWKYKLSPETVNLPARHGINEIEVFEIGLKTEDYDPAILRAIDKAIPFPIVFQLKHGESIRFAVSYKRPSEAGKAKWVVEATFALPWQAAGTVRPALPVALDLAALYEQIVRAHIPIPSAPDETVSEHVGRFQAIESKEREARQLETRLEKEKQFNRKVEINRAIRELRLDLESLKT